MSARKEDLRALYARAHLPIPPHLQLPDDALVEKARTLRQWYDNDDAETRQEQREERRTVRPDQDYFEGGATRC